MIGDKVKPVWRPTKVLDKDTILGGKTVRIHTRQDQSNYESDEYLIQVKDDGAILFSDGENFVYFYPDQLKHLRDAVRAASKQARINAAQKKSTK